MTTDPDKAWLAAFTEKMDEASPEEEAFWERRRRLGLGVGLDADGNLIYARATPHLEYPAAKD
jgi:hypothetical protein